MHILSIRAMDPILLFFFGGSELPWKPADFRHWINPLQNLLLVSAQSHDQPITVTVCRFFQPINWTGDERSLAVRTSREPWWMLVKMNKQPCWRSALGKTWVKGSLMFSFPIVWMEINNDRLAWISYVQNLDFLIQVGNVEGASASPIIVTYPFILNIGAVPEKKHAVWSGITIPSRWFEISLLVFRHWNSCGFVW